LSFSTYLFLPDVVHITVEKEKSIEDDPLSLVLYEKNIHFDAS